MPIDIKYIGAQQRWPEIAITGKQSLWFRGQEEEREDSEASALLATGLFERVGQSSVSGDGGAYPSNSLVITQPTVWAATSDAAGNTGWSSSSTAGGGAWAVDTSVQDPISGKYTAKCTLPTTASQSQWIYFNSLPAVSMAPLDSWMFCIYVPPTAGVVVEAQLRLSTDSVVAGSSNYAFWGFSGNAQCHPGWNFFQLLDGEVYVNPSGTDYGVVGTTSLGAWTRAGTTTQGGPYRSVGVRIVTAGTPSAPVDVQVGSVCYAPQGWAKAAIMWAADDVPASFRDLAIPILESYGFPVTLNATTTYAANSPASYMSFADLRNAIKRGHEVWGHTRNHEDITAGTLSDQQRAIRAPRDFWRNAGVLTASKLMAYPFGTYNPTATLLADEGYLAARATHGSEMSPLAPAANRYWINSFSTEKVNSWSVDAQINGCVYRGRGMTTYMHTTVAGGAGSNTYPGPAQHYADHLRRWCDLVAAHKSAGRCITPTITEYMRLCGVDLMRGL